MRLRAALWILAAVPALSGVDELGFSGALAFELPKLPGVGIPKPGGPRLPNRLRCQSLSEGCLFSAMPLVSQNDPSLSDLFPTGRRGQPLPGSSMLCIPTSATMGLSVLVDSGLRLESSSHWVKPVFVPASDPAVDATLHGRIRVFATLMETSVTGGTFARGLSRYAQRALELQRASGVTYRPTDQISPAPAGFNRVSPALTAELIQHSVQNHEVGIVLTGKYHKSCRYLLTGAKVCSYTRESGHERTVNGYTFTAPSLPGLPRVTQIRFYNPWYALVENTTPFFPRNEATQGDARPYGAETTALSQTASSVHILERLDVIRSR